MASIQLSAAAQSAVIHGLPLTRFYSHDEIGSVSAGSRLSFDPLRRLALIHDGAYFVLNDNTWLDMAEKDSGAAAMLQIVGDDHGNLYYGAFGSWGTVDLTADGKLRPKPIVPAICPRWAASSNFTDVVATSHGVYFASTNGVVYWDRVSNDHVFFEDTAVSQLFALNNRAYIFSHSHHVRYLDVTNRSLVELDNSQLEGSVIDQTTALDGERALIATGDHRLMTFDGHRFTPWISNLGERAGGRITSLERMLDGTIAIAVSGKGLSLVSTDGAILLSLTDVEHHRITDLATNEAGVLWVATERGVEKVLYQSPVSIFGQRLGLPISWPQVARWHDRVVIATGGRLYETVPASTASPARFEPVPSQPVEPIWAIASNGPRMIVGNGEAIFSRKDDGSFEPVLTGINVDRLVMVAPDFCYFITTSQIGALRWTDGRWSECAPRVPGIGFPAIAHSVGKSAWIELGRNKAARISFRDGHLHTRIFDQFPWKEPQWINIGAVGDTVVLSGQSGRICFNEKTESVVAAPEIQELLARAPLWINRIQEDANGTLWATHDQGLMTMRRNGHGYDIDATTFSIINDRYPKIQLLGGNDVWCSTGQSLYHIDRHDVPETASGFKPVLVSITHEGKNSDLERRERLATSPLRFPYTENNLSFRFFAGSYASRRSPGYEFRLNGASRVWTSFGNSSFTLPNLREGNYRLDVRLAEIQPSIVEPLSIDFEIGPPWFRTWYAYTFYYVAAALAALGLFRWLVHRTYAHNQQLERLVQERTGQLEVAMEQLKEETRNTATLAERDRLAAEIHDSVQQGLSGVMLQIDATLKLPTIANDIRSRLSVARNMISFTRHEVQHAVWNMESPLLEGTELGDALKKIADLVSPGASLIEISVQGTPLELSSSTKHHVLRIAQEAITNAIRHAGSKTIALVLAHESDQLLLTITDDGCGFRPAEVLAKGLGHFGLRGMRERVAKIGGSLEIHSAPGEGTAIRLVVPVVVRHSVESNAVTR